MLPQIVRQRYLRVACLVSIPKPKLRTGVGRNNVLFVIVEDSALAPLFSWLIKGLNERDLRLQIKPKTTTAFLYHWRAGLRRLELVDGALLPSGLLPGDTTHHYLTHQDIL